MHITGKLITSRGHQDKPRLDHNPSRLPIKIVGWQGYVQGYGDFRGILDEEVEYRKAFTYRKYESDIGEE